jgi:hypothetical protein
LFFLMILSQYLSIKSKSFLFKLGTILPFLFYFLLNQASDLCADFPLSIHFCFVYYLYFQIIEKKIQSNFIYFFIGIFTGIIPLIKIEGLFIALSFLFFLIIERKLFRYPKPFIYLLFGFSFCISFFLYYKMNAPEINPMRISLEHLRNIILDFTRYKNLFTAFFLFNSLVLYFSVPVILILYFKNSYKSLKILIPILIVYCIYNGIFLITSENQLWHLQTAYARLCLQLVPSFFFASQYLIKKNAI